MQFFIAIWYAYTEESVNTSHSTFETDQHLKPNSFNVGWVSCNFKFGQVNTASVLLFE